MSTPGDGKVGPTELAVLRWIPRVIVLVFILAVVWVFYGG